MSKGEFDIIKRYFQRSGTMEASTGVALSIGDDAAILDIPAGYQLAVTTDTLVSGVHFFDDVDPFRLGYKSLAVNLSDLAAMGAKAKWVSLAITLPDIDEDWLQAFCRGFFALADKYHVHLVGGDTTKGPLSITISAKGLVESGKALTRQHAKAGDLICCSGSLGNGALGLAVKNAELKLSHSQFFVDALEITEPRLTFASLLPGLVSSCIDISDGLTQDLSHLLEQSQCHAEITLENLPLSEPMLDEIKHANISLQQAWEFALMGGDDYELLFTIPEANWDRLNSKMKALGLTCFNIGRITASTASVKGVLEEPYLRLTYHQQPVDLALSGWDHFKK